MESRGEDGPHLLIAEQETRGGLLQKGQPQARAQLLRGLGPQLRAHLDVHGRALLLLHAAGFSPPAAGLDFPELLGCLWG